MEAIIFIGIQATGKTTFYREHFLHTHVRISMDLLRSRHRERLFLDACLKTGQRFVVDNTNPSAGERAAYLVPARAAGFATRGYYFASSVKEALARNRERTEKQFVPDRGILGTHARLEIPKKSEGFDELFYVSFEPELGYRVQGWRDEN